MISLLVTLFLSVSVRAQEVVTKVTDMPVASDSKTGDVGMGLIVGTPTAFNMKFWTTETTAVNVNAAYTQGDIGIMADHLWHFRIAQSAEVGNERPSVFAPYLGVGLTAVFDAGNERREDRTLFRRTGDSEASGFGGRIPLGLEFLPYDQRFSIFGELAPGAILSPEFFSFVQAGVGGRFYF